MKNIWAAELTFVLEELRLALFFLNLDKITLSQLRRILLNKVIHKRGWTLLQFQIKVDSFEEIFNLLLIEFHVKFGRNFDKSLNKYLVVLQEERRNFECSNNEISLEKVKDLKNHRNGEGSGKRVFMCDLCNKEFNEK